MDQSPGDRYPYHGECRQAGSGPGVPGGRKENLYPGLREADPNPGARRLAIITELLCLPLAELDLGIGRGGVARRSAKDRYLEHRAIIHSRDARGHTDPPENLVIGIARAAGFGVSRYAKR